MTIWVLHLGALAACVLAAALLSVRQRRRGAGPAGVCALCLAGALGLAGTTMQLHEHAQQVRHDSLPLKRAVQQAVRAQQAAFAGDGRYSDSPRQLSARDGRLRQAASGVDLAFYRDADGRGVTVVARAADGDAMMSAVLRDGQTTEARCRQVSDCLRGRWRAPGMAAPAAAYSR